MYTQGGMESQAQLFLLDDKTFCFTFMGGSLDLIRAGHWKKTTAEATINLQETRPETQLYPAIGKNLDRLGPPMVGIYIDGYSLSNAHSPVFAVTSTDDQPATFRPLFPSGKSNWSGTYALPLMPPEKAKYFFIGDVEIDKYNRPKKLRITQYKIENYDSFRIGFDEIQSDPAMNSNAQLINNVLQMDGGKFGSKVPLNQNTITDVREQCIKPILFPESGQSKQGDSLGQQSAKVEMLKPIKSFSLDVSAIEGEPIFADGDKDATKGSDTLEDMIEAEQTQLQAAFEGANNGAQPIDNFLKLTNDLAGKKRIKRHAPLVVKLYAELLVNQVGKGQFPVSEKLFFNFVENIYPVMQSVKNEAMLYSQSVIASQGLIMTVATKNDEIRKVVFEKLLGEKFDIATHPNRTLIYNMACYYATINNKSAMLDAIKQARKRKTPAKQFMADADFKNLWKDAEFLEAVKE